MKTKLVLGIVIAMLAVIAGIYYFSSSASGTNAPLNPKVIATTPTDTQNSGAQSTVSLADLATHNSLGNCWVGYKGKAYDISSFLPNHPGKPQMILPYCGTAKEFEAAFTKKHGTKKVALLMKVGAFMGLVQDKGTVA